MIQVSLVAFVVAGLASPLSYFDFAFQLFAICALLPEIVATKEPSAVPSDQATTEGSSTRQASVAVERFEAGRT